MSHQQMNIRLKKKVAYTRNFRATEIELLPLVILVRCEPMYIICWCSPFRTVTAKVQWNIGKLHRLSPKRIEVDDYFIPFTYTFCESKSDAICVDVSNNSFDWNWGRAERIYLNGKNLLKPHSSGTNLPTCSTQETFNFTLYLSFYFIYFSFLSFFLFLFCFIYFVFGSLHFGLSTGICWASY